MTDSDTPLPTLAELRDAHDREVITRRLEICGWNETLAAETLGITRRALLGLRTRLGVQRPGGAYRRTSSKRRKTEGEAGSGAK